MNKLQESIYYAIDRLIDKKLNKTPYLKRKNGIIVDFDKYSNTFSVLVDETRFENIYALDNIYPTLGDVVLLNVPNNYSEEDLLIIGIVKKRGVVVV